MRFAVHVGLVLLAVLGPAAGCMTVRTRTLLMRQAPKMEATAAELRLRAVELARRLAGRMQRFADAVQREAEDPAVRRSALASKLDGTMAVQSAAMQPDPFVALLDLWALTFQLADYVGPGGLAAAAFGPFQPLAVEAVHDMGLDAERAVAAAAPKSDIDGGRERVRRWATRHPIESATVRESISGTLASDLFPKERTALDAVTDINQTARDIEYRLGFFNDYLLKQARWTAELAALDALTGFDAAAGLASMLQTADDVGMLARSLPAVIADERAAVLAALDAELGEALAFVDRERMMVLETLQAERLALLEAITAERKAGLAALSAERESTMVELRALATAVTVGAIDHAVWRLVQLLAVAGVLGFAAVLAWRRARTPTVHR